MTTGLLNIPIYDEDYCYRMGKDCAINGANETNCHFAIFATKEKTKAWERGNKEAKDEQEAEK